MTTIQCQNGHKITLTEQQAAKFAGKSVKCPKCSTNVLVPLNEPEVIEVEPELIDPLDPMVASPVDSLSPGPLDELSALVQQSRAATPVRPIAAPTQPKAKKEPEKVGTPFSWIVLNVIVGVSALLAVGLAGIISIFLMSGKSTDDRSELLAAISPSTRESLAKNGLLDGRSTNASTATKSGPNVVAQQTSNGSTASGSGTASSSQNSSNSQVKSSPFDIPRIESIEGLGVYRFGEPVWAAAFDEESGHLFVGTDKDGMLVYQLDGQFKQSSKMVEVFPLKGKPTAFCCKVFEGKSYLIAASTESQALMVFDAATLKQLFEIKIDSPIAVQQLKASTNSRDPYIYFLGRDTTDEVAVFQRIGRVNLATKAQDAGLSAMHYSEFAVSETGDLIFARTMAARFGVIASWPKIMTYRDGDQDVEVGFWGNEKSSSPPIVVGRRMTDRLRAFEENGIALATIRYPVEAEFAKQNLSFGLMETGLAFSDANNFRPARTFQIPQEVIESAQEISPVDSRNRENLSPIKSPGFFYFDADDKRNRALVVTPRHLILAEISSFPLADGVGKLAPSTPGTLEAKVGSELKLDLAWPDMKSDTIFEFIPNSNFLPNENTVVLGMPRNSGPIPWQITLDQAIEPQDRKIKVSNAVELQGKKPPLYLRVGNEVMVVMSLEPKNGITVLGVNRPYPIEHSMQERVALVNEVGAELPVVSDGESKPQGISFDVSAGVNPEQDIVFVRDISFFEQDQLPFKIQIGSEVMEVTALDSLRRSLTVKRTNGVDHSLEDPCLLLIDDPKDPRLPNLPVVDFTTFKWTPNQNQVGIHAIRMRARRGFGYYEWIWNVTVKP